MNATEIQFHANPSRMSPGSWNVLKRGATNDAGEPWVEVPLVTEYEAKKCAESLNAGREAWAWLDGSGSAPWGPND